jgi:hypothetical protein
MSPSTPPLPRASARGLLRQAALTSRFIAALLVTGVSIRFAIASARHAFAVSSANVAENPGSHGVGDARTAASASASVRALHGAPVVNQPLTGRPLRVTLGVNHGKPRSDVYVNGIRVGNTPFLGDTSCKSGQTIRIEVVEAQGPPLTYVRECRGGSIEINTEPP